MGFKKLSSGR